MVNKEEILTKLLKNLLDGHLKRLEKRNIEQMKDIKLEIDSYHKQGLLLKKLCSVKIEPKNNSKKIIINKLNQKNRDKTPSNLERRVKSTIKEDDTKMIRSKTPITSLRKKKPEAKEKGKNDASQKTCKTPLKMSKKTQKSNNIKIPSTMTSINLNKNKNKKDNEKFNLIVKKAKTPDIRTKNKIIKKNIAHKDKENIRNNNKLKLIDINVEDMTQYIIKGDKKQEIKGDIKTDTKEDKIKIKKEENKNEKKKKIKIK